MDQQHEPGPNTVALQSYQHEQDAIFNGPVHLARGRQARDPHAKTVSYNVASLDAFESSLRDFLNNPPESPEHTDCQLSFWIGTSFLVAAPNDASAVRSQHQHQHSPEQALAQPHFTTHDASQPYTTAHNNANRLHPQQYGTPYQTVPDPAAMGLTLDFQQPSQPNNPSVASGTNSTSDGTKNQQPKLPMTVIEALQPTSDPKEKMRKQRAIAKCCVDTIQKSDGYRYSFHNCWNSREDDSFRFSYYCNDSLLNKDRAANGKGAKLGKRATKPVYDCKGVLSIKFSATKQSLDVFYKHLPVHKTYEERAPPPRKDSRRRKFLEENDPDALKRLQTRPKSSRPELPPADVQKAKKKRKAEDPKSSTSLESDLRAQSLRSLLELIRPDPTLEPSPPQPPPPPPPVVQPQQPPQAPPQPPPPTSIHPQAQVQSQAQQTPRKRPRNSCDVCKAKKTKCDGTRPVCQTCIDKKRQCFYSSDSAGDEQRPSTSAGSNIAEATQPIQAVSTGLSELERMKKELDEAKARIQELEDEKRRTSTTPHQTPQMAQGTKQARPQSQHHPRSSETPPQTQPHAQPRHQQRQHSRSQSLHQQQPPQPPQPSPQLQHQMQTTQTVPSPQQAMQQLQTAAQQLQTPSVQYSYTPNPYGMATQQSMPRNAAHPSQPQSVPQSNGLPNNVQAHQMGVTAGMTGSGMPPPTEQTNPYTREFGAWPNTYYGYQSAQPQQQQPQQQQQQQQENQWGTVRNNSGVFR